MEFKKIISRIRRVFLIATKPNKKEYVQGFKITGIGIIIIGTIGFIIFLIVQLIGGL